MGEFAGAELNQAAHAQFHGVISLALRQFGKLHSGRHPGIPRLYPSKRHSGLPRSPAGCASTVTPDCAIWYQPDRPIDGELGSLQIRRVTVSKGPSEEPRQRL